MDAGLLFVVLGCLLLIGELFLPAGISAIFGVGFLVTGVMLLLDFPPLFAVGGGVLSMFLSTIVVVIYWQLVKRKPITTGRESIIGLSAKVITPFQEGKGVVEVRGEQWSARSKSGKNYVRGDRVKILGSEGVFVEVE